MDIVRGNLDDISRPASVSRSRPGSRVSSSLQAEKPKIFSAAGSLEVLTPEMCFSEKSVFHDEEEARDPAGSPEEDSPTNQERVNENPKPGEAEESDSSDPRLEKAIKKMKALDELLLKKIAKEKEVVAQSKAMRRQLWEELQSVSKLSSARSHEENVNTNRFLALTPQLGDAAEETSVYENTFPPVFSTQLPYEECDDDDPKPSPGNAPGVDSSDTSSGSGKFHQKTKKKRSRDNRRDFIQRNIELVKEAGSYVLFMEDEKLRLEELLADIQDICSDDEVTTKSSLCLVPGEGFIPQPEERTQLADIEARLQTFQSAAETTEPNDCDHGVPANHTTSDVSLDKFWNSVTAPGEQVLRYTKELREQKIRLKEIDQQLDDMERASDTPLSSFSSVLCSSSLS